MKDIIKYQLMGRKNTIFFLLITFTALNLVSWIIEAFSIGKGAEGLPPVVGFWIPVSISAMVITVMVMTFLCGSGHVDTLVNKDSSYLMLSVPRRGWEILGGRFIAGLAEYALYAVVVLFFLSVHGALFGALSSEGETGFFTMLGYLYRQVFALNFLSLLKMVGMGLVMFLFTGMTITFAVISSRSLVKNKKLATLLAVVFYFTITSWSVDLGTWLSKKYGWYSNVGFTLEYPSTYMNGMNPEFGITNAFKEVPVPLFPIFFFLVLGLGLFAAGSWLYEHKMEV